MTEEPQVYMGMGMKVCFQRETLCEAAHSWIYSLSIVIPHCWRYQKSPASA